MSQHEACQTHTCLSKIMKMMNMSWNKGESICTVTWEAGGGSDAVSVLKLQGSCDHEGLEHQISSINSPWTRHNHQHSTQTHTTVYVYKLPEDWTQHQTCVFVGCVQSSWRWYAYTVVSSMCVRLCTSISVCMRGKWSCPVSWGVSAAHKAPLSHNPRQITLRIVCVLWGAWLSRVVQTAGQYVSVKFITVMYVNYFPFSLIQRLLFKLILPAPTDTQILLSNKSNIYTIVLREVQSPLCLEEWFSKKNKFTLMSSKPLYDTGCTNYSQLVNINA